MILGCEHEQDPITVASLTLIPRPQEQTVLMTMILEMTIPQAFQIGLVHQQIFFQKRYRLKRNVAVRTASEDPDEGDPLAYDFAWSVDGEDYPLTVGVVEGITEAGQG